MIIKIKILSSFLHGDKNNFDKIELDLKQSTKKYLKILNDVFLLC